MALNARQKLFVAEYVKRGNATRAAIEAGYSANTAQEQGSRLLSNAIVSEAVAREQHKRLARLGADADAILEEVAAIAFSKLDDYAEWGPGRFELKESGEVDARAVQSVTIKEVTISTPNGDIVKTEQGIKTHDKLAALKLLGQRVGIFVDRKEITGRNGGPLVVQRKSDLPDDELDRRITELESQVLGASEE